MRRTPMPKASINEHGEPPFAKYEIRLAGNFGMPPPTFDAVPSEKGSQFDFRVLVVGPANRRHDL
jgi:hypothetical protein